MATVQQESAPQYRLTVDEEELGIIISLLGRTGSDSRSPRKKDDLYTTLQEFLWPEGAHAASLPFLLVPHERAASNPGLTTMVLAPATNEEW